MRTLRLAVLFALTLQAIWTSDSRASDRLTIQLQSNKTDYVLGETVILQVAVHNNSGEKLPAWVDLLDYQIQVFLRGPDEAMREFTIGWRVNLEVFPSTIPLAPQESADYALRILHTFKSKSAEGAAALAFPKAGEYDIFVKYPLHRKQEIFESNTIRIDVKEPEGVDAEIWKQLNDAKILFFLQRGGLWEESEYVPVKVAQLILGTPASPSSPAVTRKSFFQKFFRAKWGRWSSAACLG